MQYEDFIERVRERGEFRDRGVTEDATRATVETLGERLPGTEAAEFAAQLPRELAKHMEPYAAGSSTASEFGIDDFYRKVAEREGSEVTADDARKHVRAVFSTLREAVSEGEFTSMLTRLSEGFGDPLR